MFMMKIYRIKVSNHVKWQFFPGRVQKFLLRNHKNIFVLSMTDERTNETTNDDDDNAHELHKHILLNIVHIHHIHNIQCCRTAFSYDW